MKRLLRLSPIVVALALVSSTQLSCSVNDYCLNCENGDGGGSGSNNDGGMDGQGDGGPDAGCVPTGGPEQCNGKDDDCNGLIDDNTEHEGEACPNVQGACAGGVLQCVDGANKQTETCNKQAGPEVCDGIDNNCSGPIGTTNGVDEGDPGPPAAVGTAELTAQCGNGLDEDLDGTPDDGCPGAGSKCGTDQGECIAGQYHCDPATGFLKCENFVDHRGDAEACNGKDDDCDGVIDDNVPPGGSCGPNTDAGKCEFGTINCVGGQPTCQGAVFPAFEVCDDDDNDCNGQIDEIFNKDTDVKNCGDCGVICPTRMNANTTCTPQGNPAKGTCGFVCKPGFKDLNTDPSDGCEFGPCFPTGTVEECDGEDNNCNGQTDEGLTPPALCLKGGECGGSYTDPNGSNPLGPAPTAVCSGMGGWTCTYPVGGFTQFPELRCDGKDNNCDGNIDENQPDKSQVCHEDREDPTTQCGTDTVDNDGDGRVNDGCPKGGSGAAARAESLAECLNAIDDDGDTLVNDGCPAFAQRGVCQGTGTMVCDPLNLDGPAYCDITSPGVAKDPNETCDDKDNDCDGNTDEGGDQGNLIGQDWIDLGNGKQMMKYEASRPDSTASNQGQRNNLVCSKSGAQPWTNIKYPDALAACQSIGATLCTESQWHHACSVVASSPSTFTNASFGTATGGFIEAEDYSTIAAAGAPESGGNCSNATDDDNDGRVNDGCPVSGVSADTNCADAASDGDSDSVVNDGCPAVGPQAWVPDYTTTVGNGTAPNNVSKFSGIADMEAVANLGGSIAVGSIATQAPRMDYTVNFPVSSANYRIWVKVFANNTADDKLYVSVDGANTIAVTAAAPGSCSQTSTCPTGSLCIDTNANGFLDTCTPVWQWVNTNIALGTLAAGNHTISVYMGDDGVKVDRLFVVNGTTNAATAETSLTGAGFKWAYSSSQNTYQPNTCNGHDYRQVTNSTLTRTNQGIVTVTTTTAHPFVVGDLVQISGASVSSLDGTWTVLSTPTSTTFTYMQPVTSPTITSGSPATGGTATEARDPALPTGSLTSCVANTGTGAFDMSGNVREWTLAHFSGENPIRGGASNGTADGISCPLSFTLADDTFFFPNIGFRCCR